MEDYLIILYRTIFLYLLILVVFRLMGKREVGELGLSDIVVYVIIAEVATFALDDPSKPILEAIFPILILLVIQYTNSLVVLKHKPIRDLIDGDPSLMIYNGQLMQDEMKRQRYNLDDLLQQLREQGVSSIGSISYAFLEQSGKLSVFYKDDYPYMLPLILDGYIDKRHLRLIGKDESWLMEQLAAHGYYEIHKIFYCSYEQGKLVVQLKTT
jgi:uncharacterized membrane protein YcaP (DUF421 family)